MNEKEATMEEAAATTAHSRAAQRLFDNTRKRLKEMGKEPQGVAGRLAGRSMMKRED
jgi:hypothetical protein